jgi:hypothetical protein
MYDEQINYDTWIKKYKPSVIREAGKGKQIVNADRTPAYTWFDTNGEDIDIMMTHAEPNTVWTERYDVDDKPYLTSGIGIVDRICYYVTEVSHEGKDIVVQNLQEEE